MRLLLLAIVLLMIVGGSIDIALDAPSSWWSTHVLYELFLIAAGLVGAVWLWLGWIRAERDNRSLRQSLEAERDAWRARAQRALNGLGQEVSRQFELWELTAAERDVALLLLKGRSHKEIAAHTGRSERTVRQHAVSVYGKAGPGGRAELAAFFLEDIVLPASDERGAAAPSSAAGP
jgi:DNA-binding CsgD family transcriptional regulator